MFCTRCGAEVPDDGKYCAHCGNAMGVDSNMFGAARENNFMANRAKYEILFDLARKEKVSYSFWMIVGILQVCSGWLLDIFGWWMVIVGVLNIVHALDCRHFSKRLFQGAISGNQAIGRYQDGLFGMIVVAAYNVVVGEIVGAVVSVWEFHVRNFVLRNKYHLIGLQPMNCPPF